MSIGMLVLAEIVFFFMAVVSFVNFLGANYLEFASLNKTSLIMMGAGLLGMGLYLGAWITERRLKKSAEIDQVEQAKMKRF